MAQVLKGKRKRQVSDEDGDKNQVLKKGEDENMCPNGSKPTRGARGHAKGSQKLFTSGGDAAKMKGLGKDDDYASAVVY